MGEGKERCIRKNQGPRRKEPSKRRGQYICAIIVKRRFSGSSFDGIIMRKIGLNDCPYCASSEVYRSHPKTWSDLASLFFLLGLARCHCCMRRHYRPLFFSAPEYVTPSAKRPVRTRADDGKRERSA